LNPVADRLTAAVAALPVDFTPSPNRDATCPEFEKLISVFSEVFPEKIADDLGSVDRHRDDVRWALANGLCYTGIPNGTGSMRSKNTAAEVATVLENAAKCATTKTIHLCPLDLADDIPPITFGPCAVRRFTGDEFDAAIQGPRLRRQFRSLRLECSAYSRFDWLVVEEEIACPDKVGKRSLPFLWFDLNKDFGSINPHSRRWPQIVERAVFTLLLLPQEGAMTYPSTNWRNFSIPWVYSVSGDPFQSPNYPKGHDTLTWEPDFYFDQYSGEEVETEKPTSYPMEGDVAISMYSTLSDQRWDTIAKAVTAASFNPLIMHFLVRAFVSEGIDEFVAHISAIEAALGLKSDHDQRSRPKISSKNPGATFRVAQRISKLLDSAQARDDYLKLFGIRSDFVHGHQVGEISSAERLMARRLARATSDAMVDAAIATTALSRDDYLASLCP
jgi:hypothetical protein